MSDYLAIAKQLLVRPGQPLETEKNESNANPGAGHPPEITGTTKSDVGTGPVNSHRECEVNELNVKGTNRGSLKGIAVEVWADSAGGHIWIVADEEDARLAADRGGVGRGDVWTKTEIELVARIKDPLIVREVASWKRHFQGAIKEGPPTGTR